MLTQRFGAPPLRLDDAQRTSALRRLADCGVLGGASYDGLVALEAQAHRQRLLTLDQRAQSTYRRLGVGFAVIAA